MVMMTHESWKMNPSILETCPNIHWIGTFPCHIRDLEFPTFAQVVMREELQKLRKDHAERVQELQGAAEETVVIRTHFEVIKWILKRIQMMQLLVISSDFFPKKKSFIVWVGFTKLLCIDWLASTVTGFQTWKNDEKWWSTKKRVHKNREKKLFNMFLFNNNSRKIHESLENEQIISEWNMEKYSETSSGKTV